MLGFFGKLFFGFLAVVLVLAILGFFLKRRDAKTASTPVRRKSFPRKRSATWLT